MQRNHTKWLNEKERHKAEIKLIEETKGPNHPDLAACLFHYSAYAETHKEAEALLRRALEIREHALGPEAPETAESLGNLAYILGVQERFSEGEPLIVRALSILEKTKGKESWQYRVNLELLGNFYALQGRFEDGEALCQQSVSLATKAKGLESFETAEAMWSLAKFYMYNSRYDQAESTFIELLKLCERISDEEVSVLEKTDYLETYMYLLEEIGRKKEAEKIRKQVKAVWSNEGKERDDL